MQNLFANDLYLFIGCESGSSNLINTWCLNSISKPGYCQWGHITSSIQEVPRRHVFWRKNNQFIQKFKVSLEERRCMVSFLLFSIYQFSIFNLYYWHCLVIQINIDRLIIYPRSYFYVCISRITNALIRNIGTLNTVQMSVFASNTITEKV